MVLQKVKRLAIIGIIGLWCFLAGSPPVQASETIKVNGSGAPLEMLVPLAEAFMKENPSIVVAIEKPLGSSGAVTALLDGALDLVISSKMLKPEEIAKGARVREFGVTPLMIVTEKRVRKNNVTTRELEDIYSGKIRQWPGGGGAIRLILRPDGDVDTTILRGLSKGMNLAVIEARKQQGVQVAVTDPDSNNAIAKTAGAIGTASLSGFERQKLPLNSMTLNGVAPTTSNLANGKYPLAKDIRFITTARTSTAALKFLDFLYSPKGRSMAEKNGVLVSRETLRK